MNTIARRAAGSDLMRKLRRRRRLSPWAPRPLQPDWPGLHSNSAPLATRRLSLYLCACVRAPPFRFLRWPAANNKPKTYRPVITVGLASSLRTRLMRFNLFDRMEFLHTNRGATFLLALWYAGVIRNLIPITLKMA